MAFTIGIDMGGTNTDIGIVNEHGKCIDRSRLATSTYNNIDIFVSDLVNSIHKLLENIKSKLLTALKSVSECQFLHFGRNMQST